MPFIMTNNLLDMPSEVTGCPYNSFCGLFCDELQSSQVYGLFEFHGYDFIGNTHFVINPCSEQSCEDTRYCSRFL